MVEVTQPARAISKATALAMSLYGQCKARKFFDILESTSYSKRQLADKAYSTGDSVRSLIDDLPLVV